MIILILGFLAVVSAGSNSDNKESYKNQYCTDPRTMKKHPAYTEWADAYSCTRHRCQPGGRNLAIYTVGCKRVEAPESAIECEEVVEDTNMQFPFCCTRLRCLVVVRGEVWTRVLGQPWEVLPAAPWSHMYKMKKPPPADSTFLPKTNDQGPVYELTDNDSEQGNHEKMLLRSGKKAGSEAGSGAFSDVPSTSEVKTAATPPDVVGTGRKTVGERGDYNEIQNGLRTALPAPDIVIALSTNNDAKESSHSKKSETSRSSRHNKRRYANAQPPVNYFEEDVEKEKQSEQSKLEMEGLSAATDPPQELTEEEKDKFFANNYYAMTQKPPHKSHRRDNTRSPISWTEIPLSQWNAPKERGNVEPRVNEHKNNEYSLEPHLPEHREPKHEALQIPAKKAVGDTKPANLQALVDAIGTRMRDIESVVQKMSDKVHQVKATTEGSNEKRASAERDGSHKRYLEFKRPSIEDENYKRFTVKRVSKYLHSSTGSTTEKPLFIEDSNLNGYFSDASNSILRRNNPLKTPKEPPPTYMAPVVENHHKGVHIAIPDPSEDGEKKHKKHTHKKKKSKSTHLHKKRYRSKEDKRKHFNKLNSGEMDKNAVSVDESSDLGQ